MVHAELRERDAVRMLGVALELAGDRDDAMLGKRPHLAGVAHAATVRVVPQREPPELVAAQLAVAVVVESRERVVAGFPEQPESDAAE